MKGPRSPQISQEWLQKRPARVQTSCVHRAGDAQDGRQGHIGMEGEVGPTATEASSRGGVGWPPCVCRAQPTAPTLGPAGVPVPQPWERALPCTAWVRPGSGRSLEIQGTQDSLFHELPLLALRSPGGPTQAVVCTHPGRRLATVFRHEDSVQGRGQALWAGPQTLPVGATAPNGLPSGLCRTFLRFPHPVHQTRRPSPKTPGFPSSLCCLMGSSGLAATPGPSPGPCSSSSKTATPCSAVQTHPALRRNGNNYPEGHSPGSLR